MFAPKLHGGGVDSTPYCCVNLTETSFRCIEETEITEQLRYLQFFPEKKIVISILIGCETEEIG